MHAKRDKLPQHPSILVPPLYSICRDTASNSPQNAGYLRFWPPTEAGRPTAGDMFERRKLSPKPAKPPRLTRGTAKLLYRRIPVGRKYSAKHLCSAF
ncbi:MAG: hypothetical protein AAF802_20380, partial [Planctomycetota bacterium]